MARKRKYTKGDLSNKRRKKRSFKFYLYPFIVVAFMVGMVFFFRMDTFQVKEIKISGMDEASAQSIKSQTQKLLAGSFLAIIPRSSLFFYPQKKIQAIIQNDPAVSEISVAVSPNGTLNIDILERKAVAVWCNSTCYSMDAKGFIFARSLDNSGFIKYSGLVSGDPINKNFEGFEDLAKFVKDLNSAGLDVAEVAVPSVDDGQITLSSGLLVHFLVKPSLYLETASNIKLFLSNAKTQGAGQVPDFAYIDARYGNKIFYKLKEVVK